MTETPLEALIARLQAATGPDRELDLRIRLAITNPPIMTDGGGYAPNSRPPAYTPAREIWTDDWPYWNDRGQIEGACTQTGALYYTASLDAALSLYKVKPDRIPSDPITATIEALRQW